MDFLLKIEAKINALLFKLTEIVMRGAKKVSPAALRTVFSKLMVLKVWILENFKNFPALSKVLLLRILENTKALIKELDIKSKLQATIQKAFAQYSAEHGEKGGKLRRLLLSPFLVIGQWVQGLTLTQSVLLLSSACASVIAVVAMTFSGQRLIEQTTSQGRVPASEAEVAYARPEYYKKQFRQQIFTNLRLPVYVPEINELRSVDIDFAITLSNRSAKMALDKKEFLLRDHLILEMEPVIASFPLEQEGKDVIKEKLFLETSQFLKDQGIEGDVEEIEITYILAN